MQSGWVVLFAFIVGVFRAIPFPSYGFGLPTSPLLALFRADSYIFARTALNRKDINLTFWRLINFSVK